jgi:hypothetical protein
LEFSTLLFFAMASPVQFPEANGTLGKPQGMSDEECGPLPVYRDGQQCISCWRFTPEEMEVLLQTHCVFVGVLSGQSQPPIWVKGAAPVKEEAAVLATDPT